MRNSCILDLHFNSQQARRHMQLFGRTLKLHHAHGTRLLPLPIRCIRNTDFIQDGNCDVERVSTQW